MKAAYSRACDNWMVCNKKRPISQFDVITLFKEAYYASATVTSAVNGFNASGLWPFNGMKFDKELAVITSIVEDDIKPAPTIQEVADVHRAPVLASTEGDIQQASTIQVVADVHMVSVIGSTEDDIQPAPSIQVVADVHR